MSQPIWPVVLENLAEQLSATQGGILHPVQILPFLPVSLEQVVETLDALTVSSRVEKQSGAQALQYVFKDSVDKTPTKFAPNRCVYSQEKIDGIKYSAISHKVREKVEAELALLAKHKPWPSEAVWQHELIYLLNNLPAPTNPSEIAGHSRLQFKRVEALLKKLTDSNYLTRSRTSSSLELPPMRYPQAAFNRNDQFIRKFPEAIKDEVETRLIRSLSFSLILLLICFVLAITAKIPFPLVLFGGLTAATISFFIRFKAPSKQLPDF